MSTEPSLFTKFAPAEKEPGSASPKLKTARFVPHTVGDSPRVKTACFLRTPNPMNKG